MGLYQFWMVMIVVVVELLFISSNSQHLTCHPRDQEALREFINELKLMQNVWGTNSSQNCCEWKGITCTSSSSLGLNDPNNTARVTKLELTNFAFGWDGRLSESVGRLHQLRVLNLSNSGYFIGVSIPRSISNLVNLEILDLSFNGLSGSLSPALDNLSNLAHLNVSSNQFSGDVFSKLLKLKTFVAYNNKFTGGIPNSLVNSKSLELLDLSYNSLSGPLRLNCDAMTNLTSLDLQSNQFNGSLPDNLPSCRNLKSVNLAGNLFDGHVPESFKDFHSLLSLSLTTVKVSAALDTLQHCKNLTALVLANSFYGEILRDQPSLHFKKLKVLAVRNCWLTGPLPSWLSKSTNLQMLDLSGNRFTGAIPDWIGGFSNIFYLNLSRNWFTGEIPKSLTALQSLSSRVNESSLVFPFLYRRNEFAGPEFLPTLDLSHNSLSGPIWKEFGNLKKLHVFNLNVNRISGSIPSELSEMKILEILDLSQNNLSGHIWKEFVNLKELHYLNLNDNGLSGSIPKELSGMTSLRLLDLSNNRISGSIPKELCKLTSLEVLDLSSNSISGSIPKSLEELKSLYNFDVANNKLSGIVPCGGQFPFFPGGSFEGNHLSGYDPIQCPVHTSNTDVVSDSSNKEDFVLDFTYGLALGYGLAFIIVASFTWSTFQLPRK